MGKARKAQTAGDLWHLSIDDLLMPPGESPEPVGPGPFVINLSTSTTTLPAPPARMPRFEGLRIYQVQWPHEDSEHPVQFRLRLGIIHSTLEADAILASVREHYPGATLESATDEDESAVAEATVTQPAPKSAAAGVEAAAATRGSVSPQHTKADAAPSTANGSKAAKAPEASASAQREAAPKAPASVLPDVPLEPLQEIRWDIDELLPDLPVTRPSQPTRPANERPAGAANARGRKNPQRAPGRKVPAAPLISAAVPETAPGVPTAAEAEIATATVEILAQAAQQDLAPSPPAPAASPFPEALLAALLPLEEMAPEILPPQLPSLAAAMPTALPIAETELPVITAEATSAPEAVGVAPAPADEIFASLASVPVSAEVVSGANAPTSAELSAALSVEALPPELATPASSEPALPITADEPSAVDAADDFNFDFDSDADTVEVEALLTIGAPDAGLDRAQDALAREPVVAEAPVVLAAPTVAAVEEVAEFVFELEYLDPAVLEFPAPAIATDLEPAPSALTARAQDDVAENAEPSLSDNDLTQEVFFEIDPPPAAERVASADSVTVEAPALWRDAALAAGIASAERELSPDSVTVEALTLDVRTPAWTENPWILNAAGDDTDAHAMEALAARISAQPGAQAGMAALVESVAEEPQANADSLAPEAVNGAVASEELAKATTSPDSDPLSISQTLEEVVAKLDARSAEATLAAAPVLKEDSQTLEVLVAKIGALVESAEARDSSPATPVDTPAPAAATTSATPASAEALMAPSSTPASVAPEAPALTTIESTSNATTAKIRMRAPAGPPAQWPIAPTPKAAPQATPATPRPSSPESRAPRPAAPPPSSPPAPVAEAASHEEMPAFDSTQTIRALTPLELQSGQSSKSFSIQLLLSEEPIHPEQIPNLDIFEAYRLYVVTGLVEDGVMHALRLGFFTSEVAAEAVAGYLKGYFDTTSIKRVSLAEHDRFQERRVAARKDVGDTGKHAAIELTSRPDLPERRAKVQETPAGKQGAAPSIWSRLVSPLKR